MKISSWARIDARLIIQRNKALWTCRPGYFFPFFLSFSLLSFYFHFTWASFLYPCMYVCVCVCVCRKWVSGESGFQLEHFPQNSREFCPFIMKITDNVHNMSPPARGFIRDWRFEKWIKIQALYCFCVFFSVRVDWPAGQDWTTD